eukprot:CAMPEP_0197917128 /NCGR_PEP_ID=MMETSP1439-20131203/83271_1 /TAXON_ID=66791 /ORGANISM="Gonyaulax spinifera, Strain CCMP409" /LENGTH=147 /DNA_ID=CAMNT_0043539197 /DNA_START=67 /DNA_END=507 /DNA_ORIENTATION=+
MSPFVAMLVLLAVSAPAMAAAEVMNPLGMVLELMDSLASKITKDGEAEAKAYTEFFAWCDDAARNTKFSIETAASKKAKLEAGIGKAAGDIEAATTKIDELAASLSTADADLGSATRIREKETSDFAAEEAELVDVVDTLGRAIGVL